MITKMWNIKIKNLSYKKMEIFQSVIFLKNKLQIYLIQINHYLKLFPRTLNKLCKKKIQLMMIQMNLKKK